MAKVAIAVICPNHNGPLCTTCKLAGLVRCPILGVPLPLVDGEKPKVETKASRITDALDAWRHINERRRD